MMDVVNDVTESTDTLLTADITSDFCKYKIRPELIKEETKEAEEDLKRNWQKSVRAQGEEKGALGTAYAYGIGGSHQQRGRRYV